MPRVEWKFEIAWHHADHGVRLAVEEDLAPQYVRIAVEAALPHAIAQHRHLLLFVIFVLRERAPQQRWHSQRGKYLAAHPRPIHRRRIARAGKFKQSSPIAAPVAKALRIAHVIADVGSGYAGRSTGRAVRAFKHSSQDDQTIRVGERQRTQQYSLDD